MEIFIYYVTIKLQLGPTDQIRLNLTTTGDTHADP